MKISRAASARTHIANMILGAASVAVALRATSLTLVKTLLSVGKALERTRSEVRISQAS